MIDQIINERIVSPVFHLLQQGVTPEKIALTVALGLTIGILPALGWTTILCAVVALVFRLNLPAIELANYFSYPLQIILLLPFFRLGERIFHAPRLPASAQQVLAMARSDLQGTAKFLWLDTWHAIAVWALIAPAAIAILYFSLTPLLKRAIRTQEVATQTSAS